MNRGAERLKALNLKQHEIAKAIGTEQSVVSRWETGERRPSPRHRAKLEEEYAIGWRLWDELPDDPPTSPDNPAAIAEDPPPASTAGAEEGKGAA